MRQRIVERIGVCALVAVTGFAALPVSLSAQTLPSPWLTQNIGGASPAGSATFSQGLFTISASGADVWNSSDQFRFVYQPIAGDVDVVARVDSLNAADIWTKVGVMIRADLSTSSAYGFTVVSGQQKLAFQRRTQAGGLSEGSEGPLVGPPRWVKLTRVGTTLTSYSGDDSGTWQKIDSATVALGSTAYVGLAITSHSPGNLADAIASNVTVTPRGLPNGQQTQDIGSPAIAGSTSYSNGTYTIKAAGTDIWGTSDQFRFVYQQMTGDVDVIAHVNSVSNAHAWSKAGVMIRESLAANARETMSLISAGQGYSFQWRLDPGGTSNYVKGGSGTAPAWVRLVRNGTHFEAFRSTNGTSWTSMGAQTVSMGSTVYVGLAVTSHNASATTTAVFDQLKIASPSTGNQLPTVSVTAPASGASFTPGANITVNASASDPENRLSRVDFFANQTKIGSDSTSPFSITWSAVPAGTYSLTATAVDLDGGSATSQAVTIVVQSATNQLPTVSLTAPANGLSVVSGVAVALSATASDPEGRLSKVEFYVGSTLVATDTASPFTATWTAGSAGSYAVKAIAYDADGGKTTSSTNTISVTAAPVVPRNVVFQASADHATLVNSYRLDVFASGANPTTATPVATSNLGKPTPDANGDITVDRTTFFSGLASATYVATVSAIGANGQSRSASITFVKP